VDSTRRLVNIGTVLGIPMIDHLIIGKGGYFSFKNEGMMPKVEEFT
jgi:DNA repair protein RadC